MELPSTNKHNAFVNPFTIEQIKSISITSVVDVGPGDGYYGKLFHHLYDNPPNITGVELNIRWANHCRNLGVYNEVLDGNIKEIIEQLTGSLIIFGDVLEHLEKEDAEYTLGIAIENFEWVIINGPIGFQAQPHKDPEEHHRCGITIEDFADYEVVEYNEIPNLMMNCLLKGRLDVKHLDS